MGTTTQFLDSEVYLTVMISNKYLEALEKDPKVSIQKLISDFIEEYVNHKSKALLD